MSLDSLITPELRARIGEVKTYTAPEPIGKSAIRYFSLAVGDLNPLYTNDEYARKHGYEGVIAPPTFICETNQYADLPKDESGYAGHSWHFDVPNTRQMRGGNDYEFFRPVSPEDILTVTWRVADMYERITRTGSRMVIVTSEASYQNQHAEVLATNVETLIFQERV